MWNVPTQEQLDLVPRLYASEEASLKLAEIPIHLHFFIGGCDWYIAEYDGEDLFFGFAIINDDTQNSEWGYVTFSELKELKLGGMEIDFDLHWKVVPAKEVPRIKC